MIQSLSNSGNAQAPGPTAKKAEKASQVPNALVQQAISNLSNHLLPFDVEKINTNTMNLEANSPLVQQVPPFKFPLSEGDIKLIDNMFNTWALNNRLSLLELWAFDLFTKINSLKTNIPEKYHPDIDFIIRKFCADFLVCYVTMLNSSKKPVKANFQTRYLFPKEWSLRLLTLKENLTKVVGASSTTPAKKTGDRRERLQSKLADKKTGVVQELLKECETHIDLGCRMLDHKNCYTFLGEYQLELLIEYFPASVSLDKSQQKELTRKHVVQFIQFFHTALGQTSQLQLPGLENIPDILGVFLKSLNDFLPNKTNTQAFRKFAVVMKDELRRVEKLHNNSKRIFGLFCLRGDISQEEFDKTNSLPNFSLKLSSQTSERSEQIRFNNALITLINLIFTELFQMVEDQVLSPIYPNTYIPTNAFICRMMSNLCHLTYNFTENTLKLLMPKNDLTKPPTSILESQQKNLFQIQESLRKELSSIYSTLKPVSDLFLNNKDILMHRNILSPFLYLADNILEVREEIDALVKKLDEVRAAHLKTIEGFLQTLKPEDLRRHRKEWIEYFQQIFFDQSLDFCRATMVLQDAVSFLDLTGGLGAPEGNYMPPNELVDFMEVEGIEEVFDRLIPQEVTKESLPSPLPLVTETPKDTEKTPPIQEVATFPTLMPQPSPSNQDNGVAKTEKIKAESKKKEMISGSKHPVSQSTLVPKKTNSVDSSRSQSFLPSPFSIRRGEKTRKILAKLRAFGLLPTKFRRGGTSHLKMEVPDGKKPVMIPVGGSHAHQALGTARNIERQVHAALSLTNKS